jgi:hypothetical protein
MSSIGISRPDVLERDPMRKNLWRKVFLAGLLISIFWVRPERILAQEYVDRSGFVLGGWAGYGQMNVNAENVSRSSHGTFALGFSGGYAITSKVVLGMELNGWTLKAFDPEDPSKGESVSNVALFINVFPFPQLPLFLEGGGGQLFYTNNSPTVNGRDKGGSWFIGSGYEVPISKSFAFVPQIRYSQGNFTGGDFNVVELSVGIRWYSGKKE